MVVPATPMEVEIIAPPAPTAPAAPPASPSLEGLVSTLNGDSRQEAARALARLWGETQLPSDSDLCTWAPQQGLACHTGPNGWPQLRALDLPALLKLVGRAGGTTYALLRGLTETTAIIELADQVHRVSQDEVSRLWNGESLVLWRPPVQDLSLLYPGELRAGVKWLRSRLAVLDGVESPAAADEFYDDALRNRVMTFQRRNGLYVDGIVGPQTWMFLSQNLPGAGIPSLDAGPWDATTPSDTPAVALGQP